MQAEKRLSTEIIAQWYEISLGRPPHLPDVFKNFMALWISFNALYNSWFPTIKNERIRVKNYATELGVETRHRNFLDTNSKYRRAIDTLKQDGVHNIARNYQENIGHDQSAMEVLNCIYTVRCNLIHGDKMAGDERDEKLVAAAYDILSMLIEEDVMRF